MEWTYLHNLLDKMNLNDIKQTKQQQTNNTQNHHLQQITYKVKLKILFR